VSFLAAPPLPLPLAQSQQPVASSVYAFNGCVRRGVASGGFDNPHYNPTNTQIKKSIYFNKQREKERENAAPPRRGGGGGDDRRGRGGDDWRGGRDSRAAGSSGGGRGGGGGGGGRDRDRDRDRDREPAVRDPRLAEPAYGSYDGDHVFGVQPVYFALRERRREISELLVQEGMDPKNKKVREGNK
jgi:hypothetical protein